MGRFTPHKRGTIVSMFLQNNFICNKKTMWISQNVEVSRYIKEAKTGQAISYFQEVYAE